MPSLKLLPGEREEARLSPHPLSWIPQYMMAGYPAIVGLFLLWLYNSAVWQTFDGNWFTNAVFSNIAVAYLYPLILLAVGGAVIAVSAIRWKVFFGYMALGITAVGMGGALSSGVMEATAAYSWTIPTFLILLSAPVVGVSEFYRQTHHYTLTNYRIIFRGGFWTKHERQLKYEAITDLDGTQSILGRILNFGTLVPVTQSGFGLGADNSMAMMGVGMGGERGGMSGGIGVAAGGGKEVSVARARTYHQLTGVRPYRKTKYLLEELIQNATSTPYLQQQVDLQRQMLGAMNNMANRPPMPMYPPMPPQPMPQPHYQPPHPGDYQQAPLAQGGYPQAHPYPPMPSYSQPSPPDPYAQIAHRTPAHPVQHGRSFSGRTVAPQREKRGLFGRKKKLQPQLPEFEYAEPRMEFQETDAVFDGRRIR